MVELPPKKLDKLFGGSFFMKLTYEDKKQIYKIRQKEYSLIDLSKKFKIHKKILNIY